MPKPRKSSLETPTARRKLAVRKTATSSRSHPASAWPIAATKVLASGACAPLMGMAVSGSRRSASPTTLSLPRRRWCSAIGKRSVARKLARKQPGTPEDDSRPVTVDGALTAWEADLNARDQNVYNAKWPRRHLTSILLSKPVSLLSSKELRKWRDSLLGKVAASSINRLCGASAPH
jgi:hypothetical protein